MSLKKGKGGKERKHSWEIENRKKKERPIDTVNQGNLCLSIKLRLECFVIVA